MNQAETTTRLAEQLETITRLNALTNLDWTVDADALTWPDGTPEPATQGCENDTDHGPGTCWFPNADGLCPNCAVELLTAELAAGSYISVDVLL